MTTSKFLLPLSVLCAILMFAGCRHRQNQTGSETGNGGGSEVVQEVLPEGQKKRYLEDAARLAVKEILTSTRTPKTDFRVPQERIDYYYDKLVKAYWLSIREESVPDITFIHTLATPHLHKVRIVLKKDAPFLANWAKGVIATDDPKINELVAANKLRIEEFSQKPMGPTLFLSAPHPIVTPDLANALVNLNGIQLAEAEGVAGDGNNIEFGGGGKNGAGLRFSVGAGDCPSGCIHRQTWTFIVNHDGSLQYQGTEGEIPPGMKIYKGEEE